MYTKVMLFYATCTYVCELLCVYTAECIYNTQQQLVKLLKNFCMNPKAARGKNIKVSKMR